MRSTKMNGWKSGDLSDLKCPSDSLMKLRYISKILLDNLIRCKIQPLFQMFLAIGHSQINQ